ncbi:hypothetical protein [Campylobacter aviculae]|uniref:Periplasmic protein n=1 Tax=Campylobacter aviculae TaxID=2510190 RepID=A0A4U7BNN5_9BACT|nr:hypothetical protein [Campylobacter aviculae]TKX32291.1 hypothetical protein CQA76_04210 [Campylobacter aviculae]
MDKIEFFLENLNSREKLLIAIIVVLMAVFLAFKMNYLASSFFFNHNIFIHSVNIEKERSINQNLEQKIQKLNQTLHQIQNKTLVYEQYLVLFQKKYDQYLKNIEVLASKNKINIKNITQMTNIQKNRLNNYKLFVESYGNFHALLSFIKDLENSNFYYQFNIIEMQNINSLNLELNLNISFLLL